MEQRQSYSEPPSASRPEPVPSGTVRQRHAWWPLHGNGRFGWLLHPALLGAFVGLAIFLRGLPPNRLDLWVTQQVQGWHGLSGLLQAVSWFGYNPQSIVMQALLVGLLLATRHSVAALWLAVSVLGASLLGTAVKLIVARPRPTANLVQVATHLSGYSFPSGHVLSYVACFGFLIAFATAELRFLAWRWLIIVPSGAMIVLVGPSRIFLGAHWASDVLGAYLLGFAWLGLAVHAYHRQSARGASLFTTRHMPGWSTRRTIRQPRRNTR